MEEETQYWQTQFPRVLLPIVKPSHQAAARDWVRFDVFLKKRTKADLRREKQRRAAALAKGTDQQGAGEGETQDDKKIAVTKHITSKQKKKLKAFDINSGKHVYNNYIALHDLWKQYMADLLAKCPVSMYSPKLLKADYHGAIITVSRSKCPTLLGITGILIQETENTFKVVTVDNSLKVVPKAGCVFTVEILGKRVEIFGNQFKFRASERAVRKFKGTHSLEL